MFVFVPFNNIGDVFLETRQLPPGCLFVQRQGYPMTANPINYPFHPSLLINVVNLFVIIVIVIVILSICDHEVLIVCRTCEHCIARSNGEQVSGYCFSICICKETKLHKRNGHTIVKFKMMICVGEYWCRSMQITYCNSCTFILRMIIYISHKFGPSLSAGKV